MPIGIAKAEAIATCSIVPTMAWATPPPGLRGLTLRMVSVKKVGKSVKTTAAPFVITESSTDSNGAKANRKHV